jgi:predicted transcriptional regulator
MASISDALRTGGKREKIHDAQIVVKLPARAKTLINEVANTQDVSDSTVVRDAIAEYLERRGYRS